MNRYDTIDSFLKFIRDIELQNQGFIDSPKANNTIYHQLVRIGVPPQDQNFKVPDSGLFEKWINRFLKKPNIAVYVDPNWQYFCQFSNKGNMVKSAKEHIKVYIPQDAAHIEKSANIIFDFLEQNNIPHTSKIGSNIRFDDIVVRLINPEDEIKLRKFISRNKYIKSGLIPANPFLFQIDGLALACDGRISFNNTIAKYITLYLQERKRDNKLAQVGITDFYTFIQDYYQKTFITKTNIQNVKQQLNIGNNSIANYMNVTELILKCIDQRFGYNDYIEHFNKCSNPYLIEQQERALENCYYNAFKNNQSPKTELLITDEVRQEANQMLIRMINVLSIRYQPETYLRIQKYLETGNVNLMPSDDPYLRQDLARSNFQNVLNQILINDRVSLIDYIAKITRPVTETVNRQIDLQKLHELLNFAYQGLCEKYGTEKAIKNLEEYLRTGDCSYLTRNKGVRQVISASSFREDMLETLKDASLTDYINIYLNTSKSKEEILREAIITTYTKYEAAYQAGTTKISGSQWISSAVMQLIKNGSYKGFTRENQARQNLSENVTSNDALQVVSEFYGVMNNQTITDEVLQIYIDAYISDVINQINTYQY